MRILRMITMAVVLSGGLAIAHGQMAGGTPDATSAPAPVIKPRVVRISSGVMAGLLLTKVDPRYPVNARKEGVQGQVTLHILVGKDGHVAHVEVVSGPDELQDAASGAVSQWTYKPYLLNGEPVEVDSTVIINFNLNSIHN